MSRAKITSKDGYKCAPNGYTVQVFPFGAIVDGKVAAWALSDKAASAMFDPREETKISGPDETKAKPKRKPRKQKG